MAKNKRRKQVLHVQWDNEENVHANQNRAKWTNMVTVYEAFNENFFNDFNLVSLKGQTLIFKDAVITLEDYSPSDYLEREVEEDAD